jgi:hypothetical protein
MGVVASVMCRCFAAGRAIPPPALTSLIKVNEAGFLSLACAYAGNEALHSAFNSWRADACEHADMTYVEEKVSSLSRVWLKCELEELGAANFPALTELNESNEGLTPPAKAAGLLVDLQRFRELERFGERTVLFDSDTGAELAWCVRPYRETLGGSGGLSIGLDADGVFVEVSEVGSSRDQRFRARRIRQEISDELALNRNGSKRAVVRLTDLDSDAYIELGAGIRAECIAWPDGHMTTWDGRQRFRYPHQLDVGIRPQTTSVFEHILTGLETLFRASVELGNPVRWSEE